MLIALTGASGFVGTHTARALHAAGHRVRALVRPESRRDHIAPAVAEWCVGDQADPQVQAGLVAGVEAVIHNAVDWEAIEQGPIPTFERNVMGSLRLLESARQAGVEQFLFVSSVGAYHEIIGEPNPALDETHPTWPATIYGAYKAAVEPYLKAYHHLYGMNTSSWRPAAIYGVAPRVSDSQWHHLVAAVRAGQDISTSQGGKITHVQDVAAALTLAIDDPSVAGQYYNLVDSYMYWQVAAHLAKELTGSSAKIDDRAGVGPKNQFDTRKATDFFDRHGNSTALRRGVDGVRAYVRDLLAAMDA